ncbi:MAG: amino acid adenylation domain-containing protein [Aliishimia sp.]
MAQIWTQITKNKPNQKSNFTKNNNSINAIKLVTRLRQAGLDLDLRTLFEFPTLEEMAARVVPLVQDVEIAPEGKAALTPIQTWFLNRSDPTPDHWNQYICLELPDMLHSDELTEALRSAVQNHEVFRTAFRKEHGAWNAHILPKAHPIKMVKCLCDDAEIYLNRAHTSLSLETGDLVRALFVKGTPNRLYLIAHHMIVDGVSWRILLEDLEQALTGRQNLTAGGSPSLWASKQSDAPTPEVQHIAWQALTDQIVPLPVDHPEAVNDAGHIAHHPQVLSTKLTHAILHAGQRAYNADIQTLLLAALAQVIHGWTGERSSVVAVEGHGRTGPVWVPDRSVGWLTAVYPLLINSGDPQDSICQTKDALFEAQKHAASYNLWRHSKDATPPRIAFNFLGAQQQQTDAVLQLDMARSGLSMGPDSPIETEICINAYIANTQLHLDWEYAGQRIRPETIQRLTTQFAQALGTLVDHCTIATPRATPSDYALVEMTQETLDYLNPNDAGIVDIYPTSALQSGMLFHAEMRPSDDVYINQMQMSLQGVTAQAFAAAWALVCARHDVFRTGFAPLGASGEYVQILYNQADVNLRVITADSQLDTLIETCAAEDIAAGFDLQKAPLSRVTLIIAQDRSLNVIWTSHHLLTDGWSLGIFLSEILQVLKDADSSLPAPLPYKSYIASLKDKPFDDAFWRAHLADLETPCLLASSFSDTKSGPQDLSETLDDRLATQLQTAAENYNVTLNTLFQAALSLVLRRYQADPTVCFGVTTSGRNGQPDGPAVGLYISTLPMIATFDFAETGRWLTHIQQTALGLLDHEGDALSQIASQAPQGGGALFDTLFVFENYPMDAVFGHMSDLDGVAVNDYTLKERTNYALTVTVVPHDGLHLRMMSAEGTFSVDDLTKIKAELLAALRALTHAPASVADLRASLAPPLEMPDVAIPSPQGALHQRFTAMACLQPDAFAVRCDDTRLTYQQLDQLSNALAIRLQDKGVTSGAHVGLACDRHTDMVVGMLAILKAGAAYVPLDPANPVERLDYIAKDAGLTHVVCDENLTQNFESAVSFAGLVPTAEPLATVPSDTAYVIYTSGSTGTPKGVGVTHTNVLHFLDSNTRQMDEAHVWACFHSYSFDFSVWEIFGALLSGAEVVVIPYLTSRDPKATAKLVRDAGVTHLCQTPTAFHQLLPELRQHAPQEYALKHLYLGAEAMELASLDTLWAMLPELKVYNLYGPTETTVFVTCHRITPEDKNSRTQAPLGLSPTGTDLLVLDDLGCLVPEGVAGELYVAGPVVTKGYLNRSEQTAKAFPDVHGVRCYKTGDLVRRGPDGLLEFCGRVDQQIKLRGFRIELGETQAVLTGIAGVESAAVIVHEANGLRDIAAYVCGDIPDDLRTQITQRLPNHMVPRWITTLDSLPITTNGKLDRRALPAPAVEIRTGTRPTTETQKQLAALWSNLLGVDTIFVDDDFFALGGHSLLITRLRSQLETHFGFTADLKTLFDLRRLADLASHIDNQNVADDDFDDLATLMTELESQ